MHRCRLAALAGLAIVCAERTAVAAPSHETHRLLVAQSMVETGRSHCVQHNNPRFDAEAAAVAGMSRGWSDGRRNAFDRLVVAAAVFARAVAANEIDHDSGETCQMLTTETAERRIFVRTLHGIAAGEWGASPFTFQEADSALNATYRDVMAVSDPKDLAWGSVDKGGIRRTERAWLAYRDAFVAFAETIERPGIVEQVKTELTARRATSLGAFLAD